MLMGAQKERGIIMNFANIDKAYYALCNNLIMRGEKVGDTLELRNVSVTIHNTEDNIVSIRDISPEYLLAEMAWYFSGRNDAEFIGKYASMWNRITDDGTTSNSAYGYILMAKYGFDQIEKAIELLEKEPNSRRAFLNINCANPDVIDTKDEPCTIGIQFMVRHGKLDCTAYMRSNDIWFGFPYDAAFFMELQKYVASRLEIPTGTYTHAVTSLHVYDKQVFKIMRLQQGTKYRINSEQLHETIPELLKADDILETAYQTGVLTTKERKSHEDQNY